MRTLPANDIRKCREFFANLAQKIDNFLLGVIDDDTRDKLRKKQLENEGIIRDLTGDALQAEIKDLATPMAEIQKSIDKANQALERLSDVRRGINLLTKIFEFGSKLASAVSGGIVPILGMILQTINREAVDILEGSR